MMRGHAKDCRYAIFTGTRFEKDWPRDPNNCKTCRECPACGKECVGADDAWICPRCGNEYNGWPED